MRVLFVFNVCYFWLIWMGSWCTATLTSIYWVSEASKPAAALTTAAAAVNTVNATASNTTLATASTGVVGFARIRGLFRINAGGTIIPQNITWYRCGCCYGPRFLL
jgi:hypothetical protein